MIRSRFANLPLALVLAAAGCAGATATPSRPAATPSPVPASASPATGQNIVLSEWKITVASPIKAGAVDFTIKNTGVAPHELLVFKTDIAPSAYPTDSAGGIDEEKNAPMSDGDNVDPAGSQMRTIDLTPGAYLFVCNIAGHFKQGMYTVVTVTS